MNLKELKLGEMCDLIVKYEEACKALESRGIDPFNMQNGTKNAETTPKYDPNRLFREGDKVEVVKNKGRFGSSTLPVGTRATVVRDEEEYDWVFLKADDCDKLDTIDPAYLKLVTPVEEVKPYSVGESTDYFSVEKDDEELSLYWKDKHPNAKAAAEAECDRLNDKWRKERENG